MNTNTRRTLCTGAAAGLISMAVAMPAAAKPEWTEPAAPADGSDTSESTTLIREVLVDDGAWEYLQIGLGAAAGAAVAGAASVALRRREHSPRPA